MPHADKAFAVVVDDDPIILMDASNILEDAGFRVFDANTGDEAKQLLARVAEDVTLLFSDVEMPGPTDGFALSHYATEHWPWIKIVMASGRVQPDEHDLPGNATFIRKPFSGRIVHDHLRRTLPAVQQPAPLKHDA